MEKIANYPTNVQHRLAPLITNNFLSLGTHLVVKVPRPRDSEVTFSAFESSCHLLLPV